MKKINYHTADIGLNLKGKTLVDLFEKSANKILNLSLKKINTKQILKIKNIKIKSLSEEELLHDFLNEIIYLIFTKKIYIKKIKIKKILKKRKFLLEAELYYWILTDIEKYVLRELKSITYHNLEIKKTNKNFYECYIVIDV